MPTYSFECEKCGHKEEDFIAISKRDEPKKCSKCKTLMIRLIGGTGNFILRGSGFYQNDYPKETK